MKILKYVETSLFLPEDNCCRSLTQQCTLNIFQKHAIANTEKYLLSSIPIRNTNKNCTKLFTMLQELLEYIKLDQIIVNINTDDQSLTASQLNFHN